MVPSYSPSSFSSWMAAPGRQGAILSRSSMTSQACWIGAPTVNSLLIFIVPPPKETLSYVFRLRPSTLPPSYKHLRSRASPPDVAVPPSCRRPPGLPPHHMAPRPPAQGAAATQIAPPHPRPTRPRAAARPPARTERDCASSHYKWRPRSLPPPQKPPRAAPRPQPRRTAGPRARLPRPLHHTPAVRRGQTWTDPAPNLRYLRS